MKFTSLSTLAKVGIVAFAALAVAGGCGTSDGAAGDDDDDDTGSSSGSSSGSSGGSCPANVSGTSATRIRIPISWPDTIGVVGGEGEIIIWIKSDLTFEGTEVSGMVSACGSYIPPIQAVEAVGGLKVQPIIPDELWDSGLVPTSPAHGTVSGLGVGATISMEPAGQALGVVLNDPLNDPWPGSWSELTTDDLDQDGSPGTTAFTAVGDGFGPSPLDIFPNGPKASELHLATRTVFEIQGERTSCTSAAGDVIIHHFDSAVVGCKVDGGGPCTPGQVDFIDNNRSQYEFGAATYEMVQVSDGATCVEVREALPM